MNEGLPPCHGPSMSFFTPATVEEMRLIIKNSPTTSCGLDPLPTWLLKECLEDLLPAIVNIINRSLDTGIMTRAFKQATVRHLLKKSGLNLEQLGNFWPVSNLSYISKLVGKVVASRLNAHMDAQNLSSHFSLPIGRNTVLKLPCSR